MEVREVSVYEAKTHLSKLLRKVEAGEVVIIRRAGKAIAKIISTENKNFTSLPDTAKGEVWMSEDFNEPLEDFSDYTQ